MLWSIWFQSAVYLGISERDMERRGKNNISYSQGSIGHETNGKSWKSKFLWNVVESHGNCEGRQTHHRHEMINMYVTAWYLYSDWMQQPVSKWYLSGRRKRQKWVVEILWINGFGSQISVKKKYFVFIDINKETA